jgi:uncharacterized protein (TIGR03083 family)
MQLTPRYEGPTPLRLDARTGDPSVPLLRQRGRLADALARLDDDAWATPSRCAGWSVQDVITHLVGANQFWAASIASGLAGTPTRYLASFDPVATPAQMVEGQRHQSPSDVLAGFVASNDAIADALTGVDEAAWSSLAEAPPGHIAVNLVVLHALWDSWIHERDVLLPLDVVPVEEPDEVTGCLTYASAIGLALMASSGSSRKGTLAIDATDPDIHLVVEAGETVVIREGGPPPGAARLSGRAVDLVEALTFRAPLEHDLRDEDRWLLGGLSEAFDRTD